MASLDCGDTGTPAEPPSKLPPARVERICTDEVCGALALARDRDSLMSTAAGLYSVPQIASNDAPKRPDPDVRSRSALIVLPFPARKAQSESTAARLLRSIPASVFIGSILVCIALIAFVTTRIERHRNLLRPTNGVSSQLDPQAAVVAHSNVSLPFLQSSHLRIIDPLISSELGELSRYEV